MHCKYNEEENKRKRIRERPGNTNLGNVKKKLFLTSYDETEKIINGEKRKIIAAIKSLDE